MQTTFGRNDSIGLKISIAKSKGVIHVTYNAMVANQFATTTLKRREIRIVCADDRVVHLLRKARKVVELLAGHCAEISRGIPEKK